MSQLLTLQQPCPITLECREGVQAPAAPSLDLARYLFSVREKSVLDLGCGTGLFAIAAAKMGAREVWATDTSRPAVDCTRANAIRNGVDVAAKMGDLFDPVGGRTFDLIVATPPQMPGPAASREPRLAGIDGLRYFEPIVKLAPEYLERGGELLTYLTSLADTKRFESLLTERFRFRALPKTRGELTREECESLAPGLFEFLLERRRQGSAEFDEENGRLTYAIRSYMAMRL